MRLSHTKCFSNVVTYAFVYLGNRTKITVRAPLHKIALEIKESHHNKADPYACTEEKQRAIRKLFGSRIRIQWREAAEKNKEAREVSSIRHEIVKIIAPTVSTLHYCKIYS